MPIPSFTLPAVTISVRRARIGRQAGARPCRADGRAAASQRRTETAMRARLFLFELFVAATAFAVPAVRAQEAIYGPDGAPTVVQRKLYPMTGRWEAGASFGIALNTALVDQLGGTVSIAYHPNEWLDLAGEVLLNQNRLSTLARNVRADMRPRS